MPLSIRLRKVKKSLQEKGYIELNNLIDLYWKIISDLQHKLNLISLQVSTAHFGIGGNPKQTGMPCRKKTVQNIYCIKNNTLSAIVTLLTIYWEIILSIIDVGPITPWDLFKTLCTGTSVAEFNDILFKAIGKTSEFVQ